MSKPIIQWVFVVVGCALSAYYLNWIAYQPAAQQDGTLGAVLKLATKWYGLPAAIVVQLLIWWVMPTLFKISPSPWVAALLWPLMSALSQMVVLWGVKKPAAADWFAIVAMFVGVVGSWVLQGRATAWRSG